MTPVGLPHSEIPGSKRACRSPRHIAACHVLRRLSVPRHPPSTLSNLTIKCLDLMRSAATRLSDMLWILYLQPVFNCQRTLRSRRSTLNAITCCRLCSPLMLAHGLRFLLPAVVGGADRDRTDDPLLAKQMLSQLSYSPGSYVRGQRAEGRSQSPLLYAGLCLLPSSF